MPGYTSIAKPTGASYTNVGKPTGTNYTVIGKPSGSATIRAGMTMGLLIPLTNAVSRTVGNAGYTKVNKPT